MHLQHRMMEHYFPFIYSIKGVMHLQHHMMEH